MRKNASALDCGWGMGAVRQFAGSVRHSQTLDPRPNRETVSSNDQ